MSAERCGFMVMLRGAVFGVDEIQLKLDRIIELLENEQRERAIARLKAVNTPAPKGTQR